MSLTILDGNFDLNTRLDTDGGNLLHDLTGSVQVDQSLVNSHFEAVPCVGTFTTGRLTSGNLQDLGGKTNRAGNMQVFVRGTLLQVSADLFEVLDISRSQSNANAVHNLLLGGGDILLDGGNVRHDIYRKLLPTEGRTVKKGEEIRDNV
jgi:hypothetical protein